MSSKQTARSPLKQPPLRNPGQSVREQRGRLFEDHLETPAIFAGGFLMLAILEWWRYASDTPPAPVPMTALAVIAAAFLCWRIHRLRPRVANLRLAEEGEKVVGQTLEELRALGYQVFHDIAGDGFNVDHVVIGPAGVFTIETKTRSKQNGDARIVFDGAGVSIAGREPDESPIIQARAQAHWLSTILEASTGRRRAVRPVVVFPGWFVERTPGSTRTLWVLEPKAMRGFLAREAAVLGPEEISLYSFHLDRFIRSREKELAGSR